MQRINFDVIVIGGGHAGIEAVRALSAGGHTVALVTMDQSKIGAMSCNPAIGGVAKSHLVYEIDALGGLMGWAADQSGIQARRLNMKKGPAVRATRIQCDKDRYALFMSRHVPALAGVSIVQGEALRLIISDHKVSGVELVDGVRLYSRAVIITTGTFMRGLMFCGDERKVGGRFGDKASDGLSQSIEDVGHRLTRLKTGTPARLKGSTIDFSKMEPQWGDPEQRRFSWKPTIERLPQLACFLGHTNQRGHDIIRANFDRCPLFSGEIQGVGPRYCPSIEDKVKRFPDRLRHQVFFEPESLNGDSIYPNGMSTSLPPEVQLEFFRSIPGCEKVEFYRPGYAVEYDSINPRELSAGLMSNQTQGLFFAGQVNRTSGYEEAAAQGLWAGLNCSRYLRSREHVRIDRSRSYIETLIDDLVTKGTDEPYRLFTSRSEFRLLLREDNAHERMLTLGMMEGLISSEQVDWVQNIQSQVARARDELRGKRVRLSQDRLVSLEEYLRRPEVCWEDLSREFSLGDASDLAIERIEVQVKYEGYLGRQQSEADSLRELWDKVIPADVDIKAIAGIGSEVQEKFSRFRPRTLGEFANISGVPPTSVLILARSAGICL